MRSSYGPAMDGALTGGTYEIVLGAVLDEDWSSWLSEIDVTTAGPTTTLRGTVADQAALHGLLAHIRDLAVPLITVHRIGLHDATSRRDPASGGE